MKVHLGGRVFPSRASACLAVALGLLAAAPVGGQQGYQKPPRNVLEVLHAPATPTVSVSPTHEYLLLVQGVRYPSIADVAEPMLRLAGLRINPQTNGPHRPPRVVGLTLQTVADGKRRPVPVPKDAHLGQPSWSPDGQRFAFTNTTPAGIELWVGDVGTATSKRLEGVTLNGVTPGGATRGGAPARPFRWMPDGRSLLCQNVVAGRGAPPAPPRVPAGPTVQESDGKRAPAPTFQDLLRNKHDERLFDYYATAQLTLVDLKTGESKTVGKPAIFSAASPAPDGKHLLVARTHRPYSYLLPAAAFPREVEVWDRSGAVVATLASLPLADRVPIGGVPTGPRSHHWRPTEPATVVWVEALDEGNPKKKVPRRDRVLTWAAPFEGKPAELAKTEHRFAGLACDEKGELALLREFDRDTRKERTSLLRLKESGQAPRVVWDRSTQDRYGNPGTPMTRTLPNGHQALWRHGDSLFLTGQGATPKGDRPFLDRLDLTTLKTTRLFRSGEKSLESVVALLADDGSRFITHHETPTDPPNYFLRSAGDDAPKALTHFADPAPQLRGIKKQLVTYKRADGVQLSFTLYLPPDYKAGQRLPTVVWAYPLEYNDAATAGQVSGSPNRFTSINGPSHLFFLLQGYAVLDGATMPVVGDPETVNNTYVEQIVASARAAIDKADEMGVTDRNRVGVGGHSYGAFMTANLLAHSDLFRAGIARSGAYNRTLTPFGFQSERRTLWQARDTYLRMSPFMYADKIKAPLMLIHGEADNNSGTFPIQSERMYQAVRGNGGTVRFVSLPAESHGYQARESIEHTLYEMLSWFDKHVKNAPAASARR
jgi:dipeptidyl aminopeptidase/acylaminoacyl peptidase